MQLLLRLLTVALAGTSLTAAASDASGSRSVIAVSQSGIMHLDESGALLAWRPEVFPWWQGWHVATNPRNGTICWVSSPEAQVVPGLIRCAKVANLNQTWDLPQPREFSVSDVNAIAFDWVAENWHLTVLRINYICSYTFHRCAKLGESGGYFDSFFAAYDIPNRLLFRITTAPRPYRLEVLNLDGSGLRELPTHFDIPAGLAVDPASRQVFVIDKTGRGVDVGLFKLDYNGECKELLMELDREPFEMSWRRSLDILDGKGIVMYNDQKTISAFTVADGQKTTLVDGTVKGETVPALAKVEKLLAVKIFSPVSQPEVENRCEYATCSALCIPTIMNGTAEVSCLCPEGERLVDLGCWKTYPLYAVVAGADNLQAVDMQTEKVTTILTGLTDVSGVDFFWSGDGEFLLFWVDAGSLFTGRWLPSGIVSDVRTLLKASEKRQVLGAAVDWVHRHLIWIEKDATKSKYSRRITCILSPLDGSYQRNISIDYEDSRESRFVSRAAETFGYALDRWGDPELEARDMLGATVYGGFDTDRAKFLASLPDDVAVDRDLGGLAWRERFFWVDAGNRTIECSSKISRNSKSTHSRLLTHPTLADAGGLDVLKSRLFWTERSTGLLWTADSWTGGDVRPLTPVTAGGTLRLLHPWRQPPPPADQTPCEAERGGCSHFCLNVRDHLWYWVPRCLCPDNMVLRSDLKTCETLSAASYWLR